MVGTAKLHDTDRETYLRYIIERIADHPINCIEKLLPPRLSPDFTPANSNSPPDLQACVKTVAAGHLRLIDELSGAE